MEYTDYETGSKSERAQFQQMFADASKRKFDLLFWSLDRLSRERAFETLQHLNRLTAYGVAWRSFTEPFFDSCGLFREAIIAIIATWLVKSGSEFPGASVPAWTGRAPVERDSGVPL